MDPILEQRMYTGARRYAAFNKSDPFALARAFSHIRFGLCKPLVLSDGSVLDGHYDAKEHASFSVGGVVTVSYTNIVRP